MPHPSHDSHPRLDCEQDVASPGYSATPAYRSKGARVRYGRSEFPFPKSPGEIDLIGWHKDILCFVEVKTRTTRNVKPAQTAVDRDKRRELMAVAREYLRHLPASCPWRLEVIAVYYDRQSNQPQIELFQNVSPLA
ncbi:MAG: hypothetical protein DMG61_24315 [Acidobacteria bacterium]|nr:MAG: hypothetical protein DMG61_24315 [Acidobacteriota bacterium]